MWLCVMHVVNLRKKPKLPITKHEAVIFGYGIKIVSTDATATAIQRNNLERRCHAVGLILCQDQTFRKNNYFGESLKVEKDMQKD